MEYSNTLRLRLKTFEKDIFSAWIETVPGVVDRIMNQNLLIQNDDLLIELSFNDELEEILREVKYMIILGIEDLPSDLLKLFELSESLWVSLSIFLENVI